MGVQMKHGATFLIADPIGGSALLDTNEPPGMQTNVTRPRDLCTCAFPFWSFIRRTRGQGVGIFTGRTQCAKPPNSLTNQPGMVKRFGLWFRGAMGDA